MSITRITERELALQRELEDAQYAGRLVVQRCDRLVAERDMLALDLHTETAAVVALRAERDKLADELASLRDGQGGVDLPPPAYRRLSDLQSGIDDWYSLNQLRDYGDHRAMAERERAARVCEAQVEKDLFPGGPHKFYKTWDECAEAIRKGEKS